ncbi:MAG: serine protease [Deltaproteobacteria bacterium]|nr:serine protease [Deltaproteobacteria bacterium]
MAYSAVLAVFYLMLALCCGAGVQAQEEPQAQFSRPALVQIEQCESIRTAVTDAAGARPLREGQPLSDAPSPAAFSPSLNEDTGKDDLFQGASIGTAWPLASGFVVTNSHVVVGSRIIALLDQNGAKFAAWPVLRDDVNDLAFLQVAEPRKLPAALPLADARTRLGSSVFTIGFPRVDVMGKTPKLSNGVISGLKGLRDDPCSYQTTVPIQPGNSGGPIFNMNGEVVGIVSSMVGIRDEASGAISQLPNLSCAVKIECLKELIPHLPTHGTDIDSLPNDPGDLESVVQRVQNSVLIVVAK